MELGIQNFRELEEGQKGEGLIAQKCLSKL